MNAEEQYKKGFNTGYFLKKYQAGLCQLLLENISATGIFLEGLFAGEKWYENEKVKDLSYELRVMRINRKDIEKDDIRQPIH